MGPAGGSRWERWAASGALTTAVLGALGLLLLIWVAQSCSDAVGDIGTIGEIEPTGCADSSSSMIQAAATGDAAAVRAGLADGADPDAEDDQGNSALACAGPRGHVEVVALLLERGADPNTAARDGDTVLSDAVRFCQPGVAALLLEAGATPDISGRNRSPLDDAVDHGDADTVAALIEGGADVSTFRLIGARDADDRESTSDCPEPTDEGRVAALSALLDAGAEPSVVLGGAAEVPLSRSGPLVDAALADGADPDDALAGPALAVAAATGDADLVGKLLAAGADPDGPPPPPIDPDAPASTTTTRPVLDLFGTSPCSSGVSTSTCDVDSGLARLAVGPGTPIGEEGDRSRDILTPREQATAAPLLVAAWHGDADVVRALLAAGADTGAETTAGYRALDAAAASGSDETVLVLLQAGAVEGAHDQPEGGLAQPSDLAAAMGFTDLAKSLTAAGR